MGHSHQESTVLGSDQQSQPVSGVGQCLMNQQSEDRFQRRHVYRCMCMGLLYACAYWSSLCLLAMRISLITAMQPQSAFLFSHWLANQNRLSGMRDALYPSLPSSDMALTACSCLANATIPSSVPATGS